MEIENKEPVSPTLQEEDEKFKLETENSDLHERLDHQVVKYSHDMELITQVRSRSAPGVRFTGIFVCSCANSFHVCLHLSPYPLSLLPVVCTLCSVQLFVSVSLLYAPFCNRVCPLQILLL